METNLPVFLTKAGFSKVIMDKDAKKHWLCALAIR